jgi:integrase
VSRTLYEGHFDEPKTRSSIRTVPLSAKAVEIMASFRQDASNLDGLVFSTSKGTALSRRNLANRQLRPTCDGLQIPKIGWHSLRHSNATLLDAVGTPLGTVQSLLGHSSPEITRGIYLHSLPAGAREAVQKVEDLLTGPKRTQIEEIQNLGSPLIQ